MCLVSWSSYPKQLKIELTIKMHMLKTVDAETL